MITYNIVGICYDMLSDYTNAIDYYLKGLALAKKLSNEDAIMVTSANLGGLCKINKDYKNSMKYNNISLR